MAYIVYFCNLFESRFDLVDLRIEEFEEAIIDDCGSERNIVVIHLLQKLLKPFINRSVDLTNYEQFLLIVLRKYQLEQLFLQNKEENQWSQLSMLTKLDIIYNLCELRIQLSDIEAKLGDFEPSELRIEPLGIDSQGNKLWYFGDLRLYEEKPKKEAVEKKKQVEEKKKSSKNKSTTSKSSNGNKATSNNNKSKSKSALIDNNQSPAKKGNKSSKPASTTPVRASSSRTNASRQAAKNTSQIENNESTRSSRRNQSPDKKSSTATAKPTETPNQTANLSRRARTPAAKQEETNKHKEINDVTDES